MGHDLILTCLSSRARPRRHFLQEENEKCCGVFGAFMGHGLLFWLFNLVVSVAFERFSDNFQRA